MPLRMKVSIIDTKTGAVESEMECHSWTKQFLQLVLAKMKGSHTTPINLVPGNQTTLSYYTWQTSYNPFCTINGGAGDSNKGIVVGVGSGAISPNDYMLNALCANGFLANMLQYGSVSFVEPLVSGTNIVLQVTRQVTNASPGSIVLAEVGLYVYGTCGGPSNYPTASICIARDVLVSPVTINVGVTKTVMYTMTESNV